MKVLNHWAQSTTGCAYLFFQSQRSGSPAFLNVKGIPAT